jgi:outer membrane protein assembly factor BamD (BamD/ComL family)
MLGKKGIIGIYLCLSVFFSGCIVHVLDRADRNEVERFYYKGLQAQRARKWEKAYNFYLKAYKISYGGGGLVRFPHNPKKDNYQYTYFLLSTKMDEVSKHIKKKGNWGSPLKMRQHGKKQDVFSDIKTVDTRFQEAKELARRGKYLKAIILLEKYIRNYPTTAEAPKVRKLLEKYVQKLDERRKRLYDAVGVYLKDNNYSMAKETLLKMKETYPKKPQHKDSLAHIDKMLKDLSRQEALYKRRTKKNNLRKKLKKTDGLFKLKKPSKSRKPTKLFKADKPSKSRKPTKLFKADKPLKASKPDKSRKPTKLFKSDKSRKPAKSRKPSKPADKPDESDESDDEQDESDNKSGRSNKSGNKSRRPLTPYRR